MHHDNVNTQYLRNTGIALPEILMVSDEIASSRLQQANEFLSREVLRTNEHSGRLGGNWTPQLRQEFVDFMKSFGIDITHTATW